MLIPAKLLAKAGKRDTRNIILFIKMNIKDCKIRALLIFQLLLEPTEVFTPSKTSVVILR